MRDILTHGNDVQVSTPTTCVHEFCSPKLDAFFLFALSIYSECVAAESFAI